MISTIFTVGSLKASRTETGITTATIVIKTSCSILTGAADTCHEFFRWSKEREKIRNKSLIMKGANTNYMYNMSLISNNGENSDDRAYKNDKWQVSWWMCLRKLSPLRNIRIRNGICKYHFHNWFPQSQQDRDRHSHCHHCDQNKLLHSDMGYWHMPRFLQLEYSVREREIKTKKDIFDNEEMISHTGENDDYADKYDRIHDEYDWER